MTGLLMCAATRKSELLSGFFASMILPVSPPLAMVCGVSRFTPSSPFCELWHERQLRRRMGRICFSKSTFLDWRDLATGSGPFLASSFGASADRASNGAAKSPAVRSESVRCE